MTESSEPIGISYIRFSEPEQSKGDSLRRQDAGPAAWCQRNGVTLDTTLSLRDLGVSAYKGKHRDDKHALGKFLKLVKDGRVPRGSYLIIENLDRLSREDERTALRLWMDILDHGVNIVQLKPETVFRHEKSDMMDIMRAIMELSRGHGESAIKSERVGAAWAEKKRRVQGGEAQKATARMGENCKVLTRRVPAWVEERGGVLHLIPERAAVVKRLFQLAATGYGLASIVKRLTDEKVPAFGSSGQWVRAYVANILNDRRALGEYQPRNRNRQPDGEPVANYFPVVVTEAEWLAARAGAEQRRRKLGRIGQQVNVFAGLLRNARDGDTYYTTTRKHGDKRQRVLINLGAAEGRARGYSFPLDTFEQAVFSLLAEIDPHSILNGDSGPDETLVLSGELARVEAKIAEIESELLNGDVAALARVLRQLEEQKRELVKRLAAARQKAANPLSEGWGEAQSLLTALDTAPDQEDARLRLRGALRRIIESLWLLVIPRGADRLCAVQIWFTGGKRRRDYLIFHRMPRVNASAHQEARWSAHSLAAVTRLGELDLRKPAHAAKLEAALAKVDVVDLDPGA